MTSMYIDFCLKSNKHIANLDKFFTGKIKKKEKQICIRKEYVHDEYRWQLKTNKIFCIDTNDVLKEFYIQFNKNKQEIMEEIKKAKAKISLCIVINFEDEENDDFSISLDSEMTAFLAELNADFSVDGIYQ